jgi:hypothetical protein
VTFLNGVDGGSRRGGGDLIAGSPIEDARVLTFDPKRRKRSRLSFQQSVPSGRAGKV